MGPYKATKAATVFDPDNEARALQQQLFPGLRLRAGDTDSQAGSLRRCREIEFDPTDISEQTPVDGGSSTRAPAAAREASGDVLALTTRVNATVMVQDTADPVCCLAIFHKLAWATRRRRNGDSCDTQCHILQRGRRRCRLPQQVHHDLQRLPEHGRDGSPCRNATNGCPRLTPQGQQVSSTPMVTPWRYARGARPAAPELRPT